MKATGIVRRIDDLGRVVIPKEIRRTMRIREGDPLEIYTNRSGEVILKKYSPLQDLSEFAQEYVESLYESLHVPVLLSNRDEVIASAGVLKKNYQFKRISTFAEEAMNERRTVLQQEEIAVEIIAEQYEDVKSFCLVPIVANSDILGAIYLLAADKVIGAVEQKSTEIGALFLAKQMQN